MAKSKQIKCPDCGKPVSMLMIRAGNPVVNGGLCRPCGRMVTRDSKPTIRPKKKVKARK